MMLKYLSMHLKSKLQYKVSFVLIIIAQLLMIGASFIVMNSLFERFGGIKGFSFYEVLIAFSVVLLGSTLAEIFGRGFDHFNKIIRAGTFDLLLIKPRNIYLQIIGSNIAYEKVGKAIGCLAIIIFAISKLKIDSVRLFILIPMIVCSFIIFIAIFILKAAVTFYTIEGLEIANVFSDGSKEAGQYPIGVYNKQVLTFFTFVIPIACVNYYPLLFLLSKSNNILYVLSPFFGILILIPAVLIFNLSLKSYQGSGS